MVRSKLFSALLIAALCLTAAPARAVDTAYSEAVMALTPTAFYRLDESSGTTAADSSGNGHNGTYANHGGSGTSNINYARASLVSGTDPSVSFAVSSVTPLVQGVVTLPTSGWPTITNYTVVLWVNYATSGIPFYQWGCSGVGIIGSYLNYSNCAKDVLQPGPIAIPSGSFMVVVSSGDSTTQGVWINDARVTSILPPAPNPTGTNASFIGFSLAPSTGTQYCRSGVCAYDEVAFFDYDLSTAQIDNLYAIGSASTAGQAASFMGAW